MFAVSVGDLKAGDFRGLNEDQTEKNNELFLNLDRNDFPSTHYEKKLWKNMYFRCALA